MPSAEPKHSIAEWQKDFREYINMLNIPRDDYNGIMEYINDLPSVEPKRKKGKWIDTGSGQECSECHEIQYGYDNFRYFCAFCGADMRGESDDSD